MTKLADILAEATSQYGNDVPRSAIIQAVNVDGTVDLSYLGGTALNVPVVSTYTPTSGDVVQVLRRGPASLIVLGAMRTANPGGGTVASDLVMLWNVDAVPGAITGGGTIGSSGVLTVMPYTAGSYRRVDGWGTPTIRQGAYFSSVQLGYYQGAWFYGNNAFTQLKGRTVTRVRIYLSRRTGSGVFGAEPIYLYSHKNATKPSGAPYYLSRLASPRLAVGASVVYDLPISFGEQLRSGYAKGVGIKNNSTADYLALESTSEYANSGRLDISWRED